MLRKFYRDCILLIACSVPSSKLFMYQPAAVKKFVFNSSPLRTLIETGLASLNGRHTEWEFIWRCVVSEGDNVDADVRETYRKQRSELK
jgi:hypothetical protein